LVDDGACARHLFAGGVVELGRGSRDRDLPDVGGGQVLTCEADRGRPGHRSEFSAPHGALASYPEMADPMLTRPDEALPTETEPRESALGLLRRPDFRRAYGAVAVSELGDAFQYIALMWFALVAAGPLGVIAVRLADSVPAIVFGLHGGVVADRWDRR